MTYLQLCQRLRQECGVSGTGPVTTVSQVGEYKRLCDWIATAWFDIQAIHQDWRFLRATASFATIASQYSYTPLQAGIAANTFGRWIPGSGRVYKTATGLNSEIFLDWIHYDDWRDLWLFGANRSVEAPPIHLAFAPDDSVILAPKPTAGYTISVDYFKAPVLLAADADVPSLPFRHDHMIIVYKAMMAYGSFESAPEVYQRGESEYKRLLNRLEIDQLPAPMFFGALC